MDKEMAALEELFGKQIGRVQPPAIQLLARGILVIDPAISRDRTGKRNAIGGYVSLAEFEIRAEQRHHQVQEFFLLEHLLRRAVHPLDLFNEFGFAERVNRRISFFQMRSAACRYKKMSGRRPAGSLQVFGQFKTQDGSHAVSEENEVLFEQRFESRRQLRHQR